MEHSGCGQTARPLDKAAAAFRGHDCGAGSVESCPSTLKNIRRQTGVELRDKRATAAALLAAIGEGIDTGTAQNIARGTGNAETH